MFGVYLFHWVFFVFVCLLWGGVGFFFREERPCSSELFFDTDGLGFHVNPKNDSKNVCEVRSVLGQLGKGNSSFRQGAFLPIFSRKILKAHSHRASV